MVLQTADRLQELLTARVAECRRLITDYDVVLADGPQTEVLALEADRMTMITRWHPDVVRPGGTWSGPSQFEIIDTIGFLVTVALLPPDSDALTIAVDTQFLRPAPAEDIVAEARVLRMTGRTCTVAIELNCASVDGVVAHAVASYACRTR